MNSIELAKKIIRDDMAKLSLFKDEYVDLAYDFLEAVKCLKAHLEQLPNREMLTYQFLKKLK